MDDQNCIAILTFGFPQVLGHRVVDGEEHGEDNDGREGGGGDEGEVGGEESTGEDDDQSSEDSTKSSSHTRGAVHCRPETTSSLITARIIAPLPSK